MIIQRSKMSKLGIKKVEHRFSSWGGPLLRDLVSSDTLPFMTVRLWRIWAHNGNVEAEIDLVKYNVQAFYDWSEKNLYNILTEMAQTYVNDVQKVMRCNHYELDNRIKEVFRVVSDWMRGHYGWEIRH